MSQVNCGPKASSRWVRCDALEYIGIVVVEVVLEVDVVEVDVVEVDVVVVVDVDVVVETLTVTSTGVDV